MAQAQTEPKLIKAPTPPPQKSMLQNSRIQRMTEYFANQPKVTIRIRKELGEQWVQINSYAFRIQAGADVEVPIDVRNLLQEADII